MTHDKMTKLCRAEGMEELPMLEQASCDGSCPGICMTKGCDYTTHVEPDACDGWCEECEAPTVSSCLIIAGII